MRSVKMEHYATYLTNDDGVCVEQEDVAWDFVF